MNYVTKWIRYNSDDGETEDDFAVEDVLYHYTKKLICFLAGRTLQTNRQDFKRQRIVHMNKHSCVGTYIPGHSRFYHLAK